MWFMYLVWTSLYVEDLSWTSKKWDWSTYIYIENPYFKGTVTQEGKSVTFIRGKMLKATNALDAGPDRFEVI